MISFNEVYQESSLRCNNAFREFPTTYVVYVKYEGGGTESFSVFLKEFCSPGIIELRFSGPINFFEKNFKVLTINFSFLFKVCICTKKSVQSNRLIFDWSSTRTSISRGVRTNHPEVHLRKMFWKKAANLQENTHTEV